jgi:DNA topoisomerase IB
VAVAENLGNTPAVCRGSYINPRVIELFRSGATIERALPPMTGARCGPTLSPDAAARVAELGAAPRVERAVLRLLKEEE